jgi:hypothetical protein
LLRLAAVVSYNFGLGCEANSHGQSHDAHEGNRPHHHDNLSSSIGFDALGARH